MSACIVNTMWCPKFCHHHRQRCNVHRSFLSVSFMRFHHSSQLLQKRWGHKDNQFDWSWWELVLDFGYYTDMILCIYIYITYGCIWKVKPWLLSTTSLGFLVSTNSASWNSRKLQGCQRHLLWQSGLHDSHECARGDRDFGIFTGSFTNPHLFLWMLSYIQSFWSFHSTLPLSMFSFPILHFEVPL